MRFKTDRHRLKISKLRNKVRELEVERLNDANIYIILYLHDLKINFDKTFIRFLPSYP
jgi:hypothetical protein